MYERPWARYRFTGEQYQVASVTIEELVNLCYNISGHYICACVCFVCARVDNNIFIATTLIILKHKKKQL